MTTVADLVKRGGARSDRAEMLLGSATQDLRSPLLTMSRAVSLIDEAFREARIAPGVGTVGVAVGMFREAVRDMERILRALTRVAAAQRKPSGEARASLRTILGGHLVLSDAPKLVSTHVAVDPWTVREALDVAADGAPAVVHVELTDEYVMLDFAAPTMPEDEPSPLDALIGSLHAYAGTAVESLAVAQAALEQQGCGVSTVGRRLYVRLPLAARWTEWREAQVAGARGTLDRGR